MFIFGDIDWGIELKDSELTIWDGDYHPSHMMLTNDEAAALVTALVKEYDL